MTELTDDLEMRLSAYYAELTPDTSRRLLERAGRSLATVRVAEQTPRRMSFRPAVRGWALVTAGALVLTVTLAHLPLGGFPSVAASSYPVASSAPATAACTTLASPWRASEMQAQPATIELPPPSGCSD